MRKICRIYESHLTSTVHGSNRNEVVTEVRVSMQAFYGTRMLSGKKREKSGF